MKVFKPALVTWIIALAFLFSFSSKALLAQPNFGTFSDGTLIKGKNRPEVYLIKDGKKLHIPDPTILKAFCGTADVHKLIDEGIIEEIDAKEVKAIPMSFGIPYKTKGNVGEKFTEGKKQCVDFVKKSRPDLDNISYGYAKNMKDIAEELGYEVNHLPRSGSVLVLDKTGIGLRDGTFSGHVAIVEEVKRAPNEPNTYILKIRDAHARLKHFIDERNITFYEESEGKWYCEDLKLGKQHVAGFIHEKKNIYEAKDGQCAKIIKEVYKQLLHRPADEDGKQFYGDMLLSGGTIKDVENSIRNSDEYGLKTHLTNVAKSVIAKRTGNEIPALFLMSQLEMKTAMTTPAFLAPRIDTSTDIAQTQNTIGVENDPPWNMSGRPTSHWGFMRGILTQDPAGSGIYGKGYDSGNNLSNLDSSNIRAFDKDGRVVTLDGTSSPPRITFLQTSTGTATGGIPVSVNMNELGYNSFLEWGYWLQNNLMQAGGANYYFENSYYVRGDYTTNAQMQALNISGKYNGNAYATYWAAPGGPLNKADMSGNFSADVNFSSKTLSNINISVSGNSHSASISGATASFTGGSSTFVGNSDGHWKIDGVTAGSGTTKDLRGSFYGPNAKSIGGLFGMNTLTTPTKYVTGAFQGNK